MPDVAAGPKPLRMTAGDREVAILCSMDKPRLVVVGNLLSDEECDELVDAAQRRLRRSAAMDDSTGRSVNLAQDMRFRLGETALIARIDQRLATLFNWPVERGEGLQVLRYPEGGRFETHYDFLDPESPDAIAAQSHGGHRIATVVMYLREPEIGGATTFPDVGLEVSPQKGSAVFFSYPIPHPSTRTRHGGAPVIRGEKWIATKWLRQRRIV